MTLLGCTLRDSNGVREFEVTGSAEIVTTESGLLAAPFHMKVDEDGKVYVLDWQDSRILVFDGDGQHLRTLGSEGSGPGELRRPGGLWIYGDTLRVADAGNGRLQLWTRNGRYLDMTILPQEARRGAMMSLWPNGRYVVGTMGRDSILAKVLDRQGNVIRLVGHAIAPTARVSLEEWNKQIASGEVPAMFRNMARPVVAADGGFWLIPLGEALVQRYDSLGTLQWAAPLAIPEAEIVKQQFVEANQANRNRMMTVTMSYVADAIGVDDALWLLLHLPEEHPSTVIVLGAAGAITDRIVFNNIHDATAFAVDWERRRIFFTVVSQAAVRVAVLPNDL